MIVAFMLGGFIVCSSIVLAALVLQAEDCENCDGSGTVQVGNEHALCPVCGGQGRL